jgi:hypothetical protein
LLLLCYVYVSCTYIYDINVDRNVVVDLYIIIHVLSEV